MAPPSIMRPPIICFGVIILIITVGSCADASIPTFFNTVYLEVQTEYEAARYENFQTLCEKYNLDPMALKNRDTFFRIYFLHDLLTTESARDGARGGFLKIPYFWHWTTPNPRHSIISMPDSTLLTLKKPPSPYSRYATFADIDRIPALYLGDLVAEVPGYSHPRCGLFSSFGWCSEREMSFTAIMVSWGLESKIVQSGIHTYSVVWANFIDAEGKSFKLEANVDNTFDSISWQEIPAADSLETWLREVGAGAQINWYNEKARLPQQIEELKQKPIGSGAKKRIRRMVEKGISELQ